MKAAASRSVVRTLARRVSFVLPCLLLCAGARALAAAPDPSTPGAAAAGTGAPATRLESLVARFRAMPGFSARFEEEKHISLLDRPLVSRGSVYFIPPDRLLRRVREPTPSLLRLDADRLVVVDAGGSESFDLGANPVARVFAHTFTDVLAGDLEALRRTYAIDFRPERAGPASDATAWRIELTPRDPALARAIASLTLRGHGLVLVDLVVRETGGDETVTRFRDADPAHRFQEAEIQRLLRPPSS